MLHFIQCLFASPDLWADALGRKFASDWRSTNRALLSMLARASDYYTSGQLYEMADLLASSCLVDDLAQLDAKDEQRLLKQPDLFRHLLAAVQPLYAEQERLFIVSAL